MSQSYNSVGQASPELEAVAAQHSGSPDDRPQDLGAQATDHTASFYSDRANGQALHHTVPTMAGHEEIPMAARPVQPYKEARMDPADKFGQPVAVGDTVEVPYGGDLH